MALQVQDDYLDGFGDPEKFGKQLGGDILSNKKTFLWIRAMEIASPEHKNELIFLSKSQSENKVENVLSIYRACQVKEWAWDLKTRFMDEAFMHLEDIAVISKRKEPLKQLANYLVKRES